MKRQVAVDQLEFGLYVAELDRPWTETPFVFQGFRLEREEQLAALRKYCKFVYVDPERSESAGAPARRGVLADFHGVGAVKYTDRADIESELPRARDAFASTKQVLNDVFDHLRSDKDFADTTELKGAIARVTESVVRNPDALLLFSFLQERGDAMRDRALKVSLYMIMFARALGLEQGTIERAGLVGLLLDIGMMEVPDAIVNKPGALTSEERALVRKHVTRGAEMVRNAHGLGDEVATAVAMHHERYDGSGYLKGLRDKSIVLLGAVAGVVDTYCAMTSPRAYAETMSPSTVLGLLHRWRDRAFNGEMVEQFIRCVGIFPVGSVVLLNSGETGIVIAQNQVRRLQPRLMVVKDAKGNPLRPQKLLDLAKEPKVSPDTPYRIRQTLEFARAGIGAKDLGL
ncbi:MAG: HD-GYP domain-containing protein [Burkholderiales bacterium]